MLATFAPIEDGWTILKLVQIVAKFIDAPEILMFTIYFLRFETLTILDYRFAPVGRNNPQGQTSEKLIR